MLCPCGPCAWWHAAPAAAIFLLAFALRLAYINHESVGYNEAITLMAARLPMRQMMAVLISDFFHPPLHTIFLHFWLKLFGFGVVQARLLSVLFSGLAVVLVYVFSDYLLGRRTALFASLLMSVSQLAIWFAQEPRPFAQLQFFALLTSYLLVRAVREQRALYWWLGVASSILLLYTDYFGAFMICALALWALAYGKRYHLRLSWILAGAAVSLVCYAPWLASGVIHEAAHNSQTFGGKQPYMAVHWFTVLSAVNSFNNGKRDGLDANSPWWTFVLGGLLFAAPAVLAIAKGLAAKAPSGTEECDEREGVILASLLWLVPFCIVIGLGFTLHIRYKVRYLLFCAAPYYILAGHGISQLRSRAWRWAIAVGILAYSANALRANYFMQWKENFRDAFAYVEANREPGDCGIFLPGYDVPFQWTITQAGRPSFRVIPREDIPAGLSQCDRVWAVAGANSENQWAWANAAADQRPLEMTHTKVPDSERRYFGVDVALYQRKSR